MSTWQPDPYGSTNPYAGGPSGAPPAPRRPGPLTTAVVMTYVASGLALLGLGVFFLALGSDDFLDSFADSASLDLDDQDDRDAVVLLLRVATGFGFLLSLAALAVTPLVAKGRGWARITLTILAALAIVTSLAFIPLGIVWLGVAIASIVLMYQGSCNDWFRGATATGS